MKINKGADLHKRPLIFSRNFHTLGSFCFIMILINLVKMYFSKGSFWCEAVCTHVSVLKLCGRR